MVLIVGETKEAIYSKQVDRILRLSGLKRDNFLFACLEDNLVKVIENGNVKTILALGGTAFSHLTGFGPIGRFRGYTLDGICSTKLIGTYHPSFLVPRRGQKSTSHLTPAVIRDIKRAIEVDTIGTQPISTKYLLDVESKRCDEFYAEYVSSGLRDLSVDIETPYKLKAGDEEEFTELDSQILRIGYCWKEGYAISVPYTPEYFDFHRKMLLTPGRKIWWNGYHFDIPTVEEVLGIVVQGIQIDAMWAWHYLQPDLQRGLESVGSYFFNGVPWKHLSSNEPAKYNCIDVDCALQNWKGIERSLIKQNQLSGFFDFVVELEPFLREAGLNGVYIDKKARRQLYKKLRKEENRLLKEIQPLIPTEVKPTKRYKRFPEIHLGRREIRHITVQGMVKRCSVCHSTGVTKAAHTSRKGGKNGIPENKCYKAEILSVEGTLTEYDVVMDWNPSSSQQLMDYLRFFGLPIGKHPKTGSPTVDDDHMESLIKMYGKEYPIFEKIQDLRAVSKSISTYVRGLKPDVNGVVHTQYSYAPATGRLSSKGLIKGSDKGVNLQNIPHRGDHPYASDIRRLIVPKKGYVFVEADSSAIEAVIVGWCMGGVEHPYVKMAQRGIHDAFALDSKGIPITDENISKFKKAAKVLGSDEEIMRNRKKRTVHAAAYGEGPGLLTKQYPKDFPTFVSAKRELKEFYKFAPGILKWHHETRVLANNQHFLQLPFGNFKRYFYDVFSYARDKNGNIVLKKDGSPKITLGEDGKSCLAQRPQGCAAMFMRQNAVNIGKDIKNHDLDFRIPGNWLCHDSYCLEVPDNPTDIDMAANLLQEHLTRSILELNGLRIGCEIKVGKNWDEMETYRVVKP